MMISITHEYNTVLNNNDNVFDAEFRRFSVPKPDISTYNEFKILVEKLHHLDEIPFHLTYIATDGDLLPINNDSNLGKALLNSFLRVIVQRKGESLEELSNYASSRSKNIISTFLGGTPGKTKSHITISNPQDFRCVSQIIDVDVVPETCRRVRLLKSPNSERPLGFYIRDGTSLRVTSTGLDKVPGIFISRLVPGGLAESTGLLAVNDEVLEVNGILVAGKSLDQVTDMMVANSSNLIITVKPANQRANMSVPRRGSYSRTSQLSSDSHQSTQSIATTNNSEDDEQDEVVDLTGITLE
ncbi:hypothetical protein M8J76_015827 [Diaphorina citri]|nr:hypothetical protein M8J76_015827 [Diaphorina citri]KAI5731575.1 hypothetical protein M8J77_012558 [Diaphorina citri]